jgi:cytochrome c peroxidase
MMNEVIGMRRLLLGGGLVLALWVWGATGALAPLPARAEGDIPRAASGAGGLGRRIVLGPDAAELTSGIPGKGPLRLAELQTWLDEPRNHEPLEFELPLGLAAGASQVRGLDDNPLTRAKIELGRQLYFEKRISGDGTISCATCHAPEHAFAANTRFGVGIRGLMGNRNSPPAFNRILSDRQFWDGRAASLEEQALGPIANSIEMGGTHDACVECLSAIGGYRLQFEKIFGGLTIENVGKAIAAFERVLVTGPSPYDYHERLVPFREVDLEALAEDDPDAFARYEQLRAEAEAHPMSESAKRGRDLFFSDKAGCSACHVGANLTDEKYHNLGVGMEAAEPDLGRFVVTGVEADRGAFKTPTIRNVAQSGPYMHDGSQETLLEVVEWYAKGGHPNPWLDEKIKKLDLTPQDKADLVAFMQACTGELPKVETDRLPE